MAKLLKELEQPTQALSEVCLIGSYKPRKKRLKLKSEETFCTASLVFKQ